MATALEGAVLGAVDVEMPAPAQHKMEPEGVHAAYVPSDAGQPTRPATGDQLYTKLVCLTCGIGEVLGNVVCGEHVQCCCIECMEAAGLGGKDGCPELMSGCGLFMPVLEFGASCKCFCLKVGCVNPLKDKPLVVVNKKTIA